MEASDELDALEGLGTALKTTGELDPIIARFVSRMGRMSGPADGVGGDGDGGGGDGGRGGGGRGGGVSFSEGKDGGFGDGGDGGGSGGGGLEEEVAGAARAFGDFAEAHWRVFEGGEDGEDEEQSHEAYQIFTQWSERFERETEAFLEEEKTDASKFYQVYLSLLQPPCAPPNLCPASHPNSTLALNQAREGCEGARVGRLDGAGARAEYAELQCIQPPHERLLQGGPRDPNPCLVAPPPPFELSLKALTPDLKPALPAACFGHCLLSASGSARRRLRRPTWASDHARPICGGFAPRGLSQGTRTRAVVHQARMLASGMMLDLQFESIFGRSRMAGSRSPSA